MAKSCSRFLGEALLRPVDKFNLHDFLQAWESSVPSGLETNLKQLDGLALHDTKTNPPVSGTIFYVTFFRGNLLDVFIHLYT